MLRIQVEMQTCFTGPGRGLRLGQGRLLALSTSNTP